MLELFNVVPLVVTVLAFTVVPFGGVLTLVVANDDAAPFPHPIELRAQP